MPVEGSFFLLSLRDCLVGKVIKGVGRLKVTGGKGERKNNYYLPLYGVARGRSSHLRMGSTLKYDE